jgi:hypothetical protein
MSALAQAARALSVMVTVFMQVAAAMASIVITVTVLAVIIGYVLIHH